MLIYHSGCRWQLVFSKSLSMKLTKLPQQQRQPRDMVRIQSIPVILEAFNVHLALYSMVSMGCLTLRSECLSAPKEISQNRGQHGISTNQETQSKIWPRKEPAETNGYGWVDWIHCMIHYRKTQMTQGRSWEEYKGEHHTERDTLSSEGQWS